MVDVVESEGEGTPHIGLQGVIVASPIRFLVRFDKEFSTGHNGEGQMQDNQGWYYQEDTIIYLKKVTA